MCTQRLYDGSRGVCIIVLWSMDRSLCGGLKIVHIQSKIDFRGNANVIVFPRWTTGGIGLQQLARFTVEYEDRSEFTMQCFF